MKIELSRDEVREAVQRFVNDRIKTDWETKATATVESVVLNKGGTAVASVEWSVPEDNSVRAPELVSGVEISD